MKNYILIYQIYENKNENSTFPKDILPIKTEYYYLFNCRQQTDCVKYISDVIISNNDLHIQEIIDKIIISYLYKKSKNQNNLKSEYSQFFINDTLDITNMDIFTKQKIIRNVEFNKIFPCALNNIYINCVEANCLM